jgi:hypothetical protein
MAQNPTVSIYIDILHTLSMKNSIILYKWTMMRLVVYWIKLHSYAYLLTVHWVVKNFLLLFLKLITLWSN